MFGISFFELIAIAAIFFICLYALFRMIDNLRSR